MKAKIILLFPLVMLFMACNDELVDSPALNGTWQVYKECVSGIFWDEMGKPYEGTQTKKLNYNVRWVFKNGCMYQTGSTSRPIPKPYTLVKQADDTWLLTIEDYFDTSKQSNPSEEESGPSPITIQKFSLNKMEWEYVSYGGDEGPYTYHQYLKRVE